MPARIPTPRNLPLEPGTFVSTEDVMAHYSISHRQATTIIKMFIENGTLGEMIEDEGYPVLYGDGK